MPGQGVPPARHRNPQACDLSTASATPTRWLDLLPRVVEVHCTCDPHVAAERFVNRTRHLGHGDQLKGFGEVLEQFQAIRSLGPLHIGPTVTVATDTPVDPTGVVDQILTLLISHPLGSETRPDQLIPINGTPRAECSGSARRALPPIPSANTDRGEVPVSSARIEDRLPTGMMEWLLVFACVVGSTRMSDGFLDLA